MQHVQTRVGKVAVEVTGDGPPLVLLHSVAHDRHDYDAVVPVLSRTFQTIAVDWPGHGDSAMWAPPTSATVGGIADSLEDVIDALKLSRAIFIGNSVGGTASLRLATRKPDRVAGLVLVASGGLTGLSAFIRAGSWIQGHEWVRRWTGRWFARSYLKTTGPGVDAILTRIEAARRRPGAVEMDAAMWRSFGTTENDLSEVASSVQCPTLMVFGRRDPVVQPRVFGPRMRKLLPHTQYVELDTGHVPFAEKPEAFLESVIPFLEVVCSSLSPTA